MSYFVTLNWYAWFDILTLKFWLEDGASWNILCKNNITFWSIRLKWNEWIRIRNCHSSTLLRRVVFDSEDLNSWSTCPTRWAILEDTHILFCRHTGSRWLFRNEKEEEEEKETVRHGSSWWCTASECAKKKMICNKADATVIISMLQTRK